MTPIAHGTDLGATVPGPSADGAGPSALLAPWAARVGYSSAYAAEVPGAVPSGGTVAVHLTLAPASAALFEPPAPGSAPRTVAQIATEFGLSSSRYAGLIAYFEGQGLTVTRTDPSRLSLSLAGPATSVGAAFGTPLLSGSLGGVAVRFPAEVPRLPSPFADEVSAVSGLSEGFDRFSLPLSGVSLLDATRPALGPTRTTNAVTASALHLAYGLNDLYNYSGGTHFATGVGIAILLWGDGFDPSDLQTFYAQDYPAGFPSVNISWYPVDGAPDPGAQALSDPSRAPQELTLDLEWAGSAAPGANLDAVYAPDGPSSNGFSPTDASMEDALSEAVDLPGIDVLSMSFGTPDHSDPSFQAAFETGFAEAAQRGITVLAASGDDGDALTNGACPSGGEPAQYPADSPLVLGVGGSSPTLNESVLGTVTGLASEVAWNGSGGGFSPSYGVPSWQRNSSAGSIVTAGGGRGLADVAGPATYNRFYFGGQLLAGNGTSFATPFWAGMVAEMDALLPHPLGFLDATIYAIASAEANGSKAEGLVGVTGESGPTCTPSAAGWNIATGWGTPRAGLLFDDIIGTIVTLNLSLGSEDVPPGGSVVVTVSVANASSHRPIAGLPIMLSLSAPSGYFGPCGSGLASVTTSTDAGGNASTSLAVPLCYLGASLVVSAAVASDGYFGGRSTTVLVTLLGSGTLLALARDYPYNLAFFAAIMTVAILAGVGLGRWRRRRRVRRAAAPAPGASGVGPPPSTTGAGPPTVAPAAPPTPVGPPPAEDAGASAPPPGAV